MKIASLLQIGMFSNIRRGTSNQFKSYTRVKEPKKSGIYVCVAQCTSRMSTNSVSLVDLGESLTQVRLCRFLSILCVCVDGVIYP
jgi:hypothetical protein